MSCLQYSNKSLSDLIDINNVDFSTEKLDIFILGQSICFELNEVHISPNTNSSAICSENVVHFRYTYYNNK